MAPGEMAEARPETPKKYSCACGLSQEDRKRQFSGKCRHCHTRPKFLRAQSSFDSGSASRGAHVGLSPATTPSATTDSSSPSNVTGNFPTCCVAANCRHSASNAMTNTATSVTLSLTSTLPTSTTTTMTTTSSLSSSPSSSGCRNASPTEGRNGEESRTHPSLTRRRSRSVDRYDIQQLLGEPPPYDLVPDGVRSRLSNRGRSRTGVRRTESEDTGCRRTRRGNRRTTPPPSYEAAQNPNPPTYEEALATQLSALSTSQGLSALIATTPDLRTSLPSAAGFIGRPTSLLANLETERETLRTSQREVQREAERQARRIAQRQAERELQIERERERERELERERLRELQVAQYCGCSKCQSLYYNYSYDQAINDGAAFPMETQVIMQEVLADGLAFCSLM